jgi:hypothetical protein
MEEAKWIVHILPSKTRFEGNMEQRRRRGRRRKQLLNDLKETRRQWNLTQEA